MKLSKSEEIGIRIVRILDREGGSTVKALAATLRESHHTVSKSCQSLKAKGILVSKTGPTGGYKLVFIPKISDIIVIDTPFEEINECLRNI